MHDASLASAARFRMRVGREVVTPPEFRRELDAVTPLDRDAWLDAVLEVDGLIDDGPALPRDGVPYLACPVDAVVRAVELARIGPGDVVVDVGSGLGRAAVLLHWLSGARVVGLEIQPHLVAQSRALAARAQVERFTVLEGDAAVLAPELHDASVFFLFCPFSGERLTRFLSAVEPLARRRELRVATVQLPLPACAWLEPRAEADDVVVFETRR
ncbi:MAG: SAM-dependent methyltransferase [Myxococcota bacterium]